MHLKKVRRSIFNIRQSLLFFENQSFIKVKLQRHIYLRRNYHLFVILTHWSFFKCKNILQTLNVYKIPLKEHQVNDSWAADEISVL